MNMNLPVITEVMPIAEVMMKSGFFKDTKDVAQAAVKIIAGQELGIGPVAALRGIDIVEGQTSIRAHLAAALIRKSGRYDYVVDENTDEACTITYYNKGGNKLGTARFTIAQAKKAGLAGRKVWQQYPSDMLYNRAMSRGARIYCPDIFLGGIYTEGEVEGPTDNPDFFEYETEATHEVMPQITDIEAEYREHELDTKMRNIQKENERQREMEREVMMDDMGDDDLQESVVTGNSEEIARASGKQRSFILGLLKEAGVEEGYKRRLFDHLYEGGAQVADLSRDIDEFETYKRLPDRYFVPYLSMLCEDRGVDKNDLVGWMLQNMDTDNPNRLQGRDQKRVAGWVLDHQPPVMEVEPEEEEIELPDWSNTIDFLAATLEKPHGVVEAWFYARTAEMNREEILIWANVDKENMLADIESFEAGQGELL